MLADIRSIKLCSARIERESSAPRLVSELDAISDAYDSPVLQCNIEHWLSVLGPPALTFETLLVGLELEHAQLRDGLGDDIPQSRLDQLSGSFHALSPGHMHTATPVSIRVSRRRASHERTRRPPRASRCTAASGMAQSRDPRQ